MDEDQQRALAVWIVFVAPFLFLLVFFAWFHTLSLEIIAIYWFPAIVLTIVGILPPPWRVSSKYS